MLTYGGKFYFGNTCPTFAHVPRALRSWLRTAWMSLSSCKSRRPRYLNTLTGSNTSPCLAHIEQVPFYGVFIDLKKAFDAMDWERCLLILEGHGVGPNMRRLICHFLG